MTYANGRMRATAWTIDFLILASLLLVVSRIVWSLVPDYEIHQPIRSMQLFTEREMTSFLWTFAVFSLSVIAYQVGFPVTKMAATPGQWLAGIRLATADGSPLRMSSSVRRFSITLLKCAIIFFTGPLIAIAGGNEALSLIALLTPIGFLLAAFFKSLWSPQGAWLFELAGGYRFLRRRSPPPSTDASP